MRVAPKIRCRISKVLSGQRSFFSIYWMERRVVTTLLRCIVVFTFENDSVYLTQGGGWGRRNIWIQDCLITCIRNTRVARHTPRGKQRLLLASNDIKGKARIDRIDRDGNFQYRALYCLSRPDWVRTVVKITCKITCSCGQCPKA